MKRHLIVCLTLLGGRFSSPAAAQPALIINDVSVTEPSGGQALATFTVSYTDGQPHGAAIIFVTTAGVLPSAPSVATGGAACGGNVDYVQVNNVGHSFSTASTTFTVTVCGDVHDEADQQFVVSITARGAAVQDGQGIATIIDDDPTPVFTVSGSRVDEGANGTTSQAAFSLTLSGATERGPTVTYVGVNGSAIGGTCGQGAADYESIPSTLSFAGASVSLTPPQNQTQLVLIKVCGDNISEGDQQFEIRLSNATNATIGNASATITITDDEPVPTLSITPTVQVSEPNALQPQAEAVFSVTFTGPSTEQPVVVNYITAAGTATAGTSCGSSNGHSGDFVSQTGTLNFSPGKKVQEIRVPICADGVGIEPNETFSVTLVRATNARITQGVGTATIR